MLADGIRFEKENYKVLLLTPPDDADTVRLANTIPNDLKSGSRRTAAYTQGQRYVSLEKLMTAKTTYDLV